ncbi:alpha-1,2 mannosyltransferase KTR1 [Moelleriella libera RCEF 2490]|uniref:Alpha-1,2 mannosyltransferase KTR1 n=1 Tax=Moelleriella libera RCEF 2490 TaxID=1081109 RepID=A0A162IM66_9HYPO|nr:alpha-1,2 mannosyltransferase KTR1 [Moelleriella libera RCEF 2490]
MVAGNARYLRYIVIAVFTLAIFYFFSSARYDSVPIPSSLGRTDAAPKPNTGSSENIRSQPQVQQPIEKIDKIDKTDKIDPAIKTDKTGKVDKSKADTGTGTGTGTGSSLKKTAGNTPLGTTPDSPGWETDLVSVAPGPRMNATFVTLARNSDVWDIARSIRQIEDRFNRRYNYDWVFLNDKPFDDTFKTVTSSLCSGKTHYGEIGREHWSFPDFIDQDKAKKVREDMAERKIIYGDSVSYRHMCRFESGFFFRQPLMMNYEYYWRVEPSIELFCDIHYDPFRVMHEGGKKYSFVLSLYEYAETIKTLWDSTKKFIKNHPEHIAEDNSMKFLSDDGGETYNNCHFWSNFEVGSLSWLRSKAYTDFFESLDRDGGFFYERWGDAPVHSIAAGLLLNKSEIHFFNDIAYYHVPFTHCPTGEKTRTKLRCHCNPKDNFDWKGYSCTSRYFDVNKMDKPEGWEDQKD